MQEIYYALTLENINQMNKKLLSFFAVFIILVFIGYMIFDTIRPEGFVKNPEIPVETEYISDSWMISNELLIEQGSLNAVTVSQNGNIYVGGDSFVSCYNKDLQLVWNLITPYPITSLSNYGDTIYAATMELILIISSEGILSQEWGPFEYNGIITSVASNSSYIAFADAGNKMVFILDKTGDVKTLIGPSGEQFIVPSPYFDVALGPDNYLFVANTGHRRVETRTIEGEVLSYFGDIPSGPTIERQEVNIPVHNGDTYQVYEDRVPETRILLAWNTPELGNKEDVQFDLISAILTSGKNARLYKKLVYEDQTASSVVSFQASSEISSNFITYVNVKPGGNAEIVKATLMAELDNFIKNGPTEAELKRVKASYFASFIKGLERIGGFGGTSDILASNETYFGDASYYKTTLKFVQDASIEDLKATAQKWLTKGKHTLICNPFPEYSVVKSNIDRTKIPSVGTPKSANFPELERTQLSNGLKIILAKREGIPTIVMNLMVNAGYKSDHISSPGTASLAMNLLDEGTKELNSLQINEKLQLLGANLSSYSDQDISNVYMNTLKPSFDASLSLFADVILNPAFPQKEFDRLKTEQINSIRNEKSQPITMALRVMNKYLYGEGHPYSNPYTGSGFETTVEKLTREDIVKFYDTWMKPNNATLIVTGDVDMKELKSKLEKSLGKWKEGNVPTIVFNKPEVNTKNTLYLMDRPESQQSVIIAGHLTEKYGAFSEIALEQMVSILGGDFTSRINMNLREDKHWAYGAAGFVMDAQQERPFLLYAPVQTDKTAESVQELRKEISEFVTTRPATQKELDKVKTNQVLKLPGQWETNASVNSSLYNLVKYSLPDDYYQKYDANVRNLTLNELQSVSKKAVKPNAVNWFMVGDKEKISSKLNELGFDNIIEIDADGNPINQLINAKKDKDLKQ